MNSKHGTILIAGGGIGGMATTLALLQRGYDVKVFEQASELKEIGAGLHMSPNGFRVLAELGLADAINATASPVTGRVVRLWKTGETWPVLDVGAKAIERYGHPYLTLYRPDLLAVLVDAVRAIDPDAIHLGAACTRVEQRPDSVTLHVGAAKFEGSALIGADGIHSRVRQELFGIDQPMFSGQMAWRCLIPMTELPERMQQNVATNWIGPGGHVVHYPVKNAQLMNFTGISETSEWLPESWTVQGSVEECLATFDGWHEDVRDLIRGGLRHFKWALMLREPMQTWTRGRVTLLGDACHATLPYMAQGAVMALEDAFVLARSLDEDRDIQSALLRYEAARIPRTTRVINGSADNAKRFHNSVLADPASAKQYVEQDWTEERLRQRYDWLYTHDVTTTPL